MLTLKDFNFKNKRVIVRCDFNVPIKRGKVLDNFRIKKSIETIRYLQERKAKIILITHLGKLQKDKKVSLKPVQKELEKLLGKKIKFSKKVLTRGTKRKVKKLRPGKILLLGNLRAEKGEEKNDEKFAKKLAKLGDYYINEAFSASHREHASIVLLPKFLPSVIGLGFKKEIEILSQISENAQKPLCVIIGGIKIDSKIRVIEKFLQKADHILLGSYIANNILRVKGICIGRPWPRKETVEIIEKLSLTNPKIHLPIDVLVSPDHTGELYIRETGPGSIRKDEDIFDIGGDTIRTFSKIIYEAKTIFWSGPMGLFENKKFSRGTSRIAEAISRNKEAFKIIGGGDTICAVKKFGFLEDFSFISAGGGAMLTFLAGEELPGLKALGFYSYGY